LSLPSKQDVVSIFVYDSLEGTQIGTWTGNGMTGTQDMNLSASVSVSERSTGNDSNGIPLIVQPLEIWYLKGGG
jgi:hypothetical protein